MKKSLCVLLSVMTIIALLFVGCSSAVDEDRETSGSNLVDTLTEVQESNPFLENPFDDSDFINLTNLPNTVKKGDMLNIGLVANGVSMSNLSVRYYIVNDEHFIYGDYQYNWSGGNLPNDISIDTSNIPTGTYQIVFEHSGADGIYAVSATGTDTVDVYKDGEIAFNFPTYKGNAAVSKLVETIEQTSDFHTIPATFTVLEPDIPISSIVLSGTQDINIGDSTKLSATITPSNATNKNLSWKSSDTSIAKVSNGVVTGVSEGSVIITATATDGSKVYESTIVVVKAKEEPEVTPVTPDPVETPVTENPAVPKTQEETPITETVTTPVTQQPTTTTQPITTTTTKKSEAKTPFPIMGVIAGLGIAGLIFLRRR